MRQKRRAGSSGSLCKSPLFPAEMVLLVRFGLLGARFFAKNYENDAGGSGVDATGEEYWNENWALTEKMTTIKIK